MFRNPAQHGYVGFKRVRVRVRRALPLMFAAQKV